MAEKKKKIIFVQNPNSSSSPRSSKLDVLTPEGRAVSRLKRQYEEKGLKNIQIAQVVGWQAPKTSKICSGFQKPRPEDIQDLAYGLCSDPEAFMQEKINLAEYDKTRQFQTLESIFNEIASPSMFVELRTLMRRDFPYVMCKTAGLEPTRFVKFGSDNLINDPFSEDGKEHCTPEVWMYERTVKLDDAGSIPVIGYWINSSYTKIVLALCVFQENGILQLQPINNVRRDKYKSVLDISPDETKKFVAFARSNKNFKERFLRSEITNIIYDLTDKIPDTHQLEEDFRFMISQYARLVADVTGESPNFGTDISSYDTTVFDVSKIIESITKSMGVNFLADAQKEAGYKCFFDEGEGGHETFETEDGHPYVETEFIIPIEAMADYGDNLMIKENIVCLCPMCAAKMQNAKKDIREDMVWAIYKGKKAGLKSKGIEINPGRLMQLWDLE